MATTTYIVNVLYNIVYHAHQHEHLRKEFITKRDAWEFSKAVFARACISSMDIQLTIYEVVGVDDDGERLTKPVFSRTVEVD